MATSESEDFESADEDFEFEKSKVKHSLKKVSNCNTKEVDNNFKNVHITEGHSRNEESSKTVEEDVGDKELIDVKDNPDSDKTRKNTDDVVMPVKPQTGVARSSKPKRPQQVRVKSESSCGPKKLGTRVSVANKDNTNICETQLTKCDNQIEAEMYESSVNNTESDKSGSDLNLIQQEPMQCHLPAAEQDTDSMKESGDGWEVEEEDGFEIPTSLHEKHKRENVESSPTKDVFGPLDKISSSTEKIENKGWGSWGSFGVSSLLSTATGSVSALSSHVTAGLSTVTSVLDSGLGAPDPEVLARTLHEEETEKQKKELKEGEISEGSGGEQLGFPGFGSLVSGVSLIGSKVITGGLDTLETIGKKTMEVLQDGDPRLMKKRAMFFQEPDKPVLSQILREAKEKAENSDKEQKEKEEARQTNFEALFDDFQGMVHLEALEMLSKQCQLKLQSILLAHSGESLVDLQETLSEVKQLCELPEESEDEEVLSDDEFANKISEHVKGLHKSMTGNKIIEMNNNISSRIKHIEQDKITAKEVNKLAISTLAEFTALAMEIFHKGAELLLTKPHHSTADEAESLTSLTCTLCSRVSAIANMFTELLTKEDPIANSASITNIYKESANSGSYIQSACQLLLPVIQVGATS